MNASTKQPTFKAIRGNDAGAGIHFKSCGLNLSAYPWSKADPADLLLVYSEEITGGLLVELAGAATGSVAQFLKPSEAMVSLYGFEGPDHGRSYMGQILEVARAALPDHRISVINYDSIQDTVEITTWAAQGFTQWATHDSALMMMASPSEQLFDSYEFDSEGKVDEDMCLSDLLLCRY